MRTLPEYELMQRSKDKPILLAGEPHRLTGEVHLSNPGDKTVVVRDARICDLPKEVRMRHAGGSEAAVQVAAILRPGKDCRARIRVRLDSATPPGHYPAGFVLRQHRYRAELHVTESFQLELSPHHIAIENRPGTRVVREVVFRNQGNTQVRIGPHVAVPLHDELFECRTLRATLAHSSQEAQSPADWLNILLREGQKNLHQDGLLWMQNEEPETVIEAGEARSVRLQLRVPDSIRPEARYFATAFFYAANLSVALVSLWRPPVHREHQTGEGGKRRAEEGTRQAAGLSAQGARNELFRRSHGWTDVEFPGCETPSTSGALPG
jgi:hypothetical protein